MRRWSWCLPLIGILGVGALPFVRYCHKTQAQAVAADFLKRVHEKQLVVQSEVREKGFMVTLSSLVTVCPQTISSVLTSEHVISVEAAGYEVGVRPAEGSTPGPPDCHGRPTASDYYAWARPRSVESPGQQAFAMTATGKIYVFFDGIAPLERDMTATGLATPVESVRAFKIP
jgi:hypothetical protein